MKSKIDFLYQSIADTQNTIRAFDLKSSFLLLVLFVPVGIISQLYEDLVSVFQANAFGRFAVYLMLILWLVAIALHFITLLGVNNPAERVAGEGATGSFFGGDLFSPGFVHSFIGMNNKSARTIAEEISILPNTDKAIVNELAFEKIKLTYIRAIKAARSFYSNIITGAWLAVCLIIYITYILEN